MQRGLVDLAWFLVALDRTPEAVELADWVVASVPFTGNFNLCSPAGAAIVLRARLARLGGDEARTKSLIAKLVEHPAHAVVTRALDDHLARDIAVDATPEPVPREVSTMPGGNPFPNG